ncbi:MAG TPA: hypothetical protein DEP32_16880 [Pseudomonas sp.]|nr:hypothetical protein [Pseudomonas sp.]MAQ52354.1 hypothetical protein [Pseudomonas sp.]MBB51313.1 hypothetical protein [Pseudomonadales bacterium]HCA25839.1 hypothetical protein [Pseudomonas sp.]
MPTILESRQAWALCYFSTGLVGLGDNAGAGLVEKPAAFSTLRGWGAQLAADGEAFGVLHPTGLRCGAGG